MLKKLVIAGAVSAAALLGVTGVAFASDENNNTDCSSVDSTEQSNEGDQLVGGNSSIKDLNGFIGGSIDQPGFCPSAFNENEFNH